MVFSQIDQVHRDKPITVETWRGCLDLAVTGIGRRSARSMWCVEVGHHGTRHNDQVLQQLYSSHAAWTLGDRLGLDVGMLVPGVVDTSAIYRPIADRHFLSANVALVGRQRRVDCSAS